MSLYRRSLLDVDSLDSDSIYRLFARASHFLQAPTDEMDWPRARRFVVALLFFEPSTRTRLSFEMAAARLGLSTLRLDDANTTSLAKGESLRDTLANFLAMGPEVAVVRYNEDPELSALIDKSHIPIIIAGQGTTAHPTQALLDAYTIWRERGRLEGERILIIGDVSHSRVALSNLKLLSRLGCELATCSPPEFALSDSLAAAQLNGLRVRNFATLDEGLRWASVAMALRIQFERLSDAAAQTLSAKTFRANYGLTRQRLKVFSQEGIFLHPGPVNQNVEIDTEVLEDPRSRVLVQVRNGVAIRAAILQECLGLEELGLFRGSSK